MKTSLLIDIGNTSFDIAMYDIKIISTKKISLKNDCELEDYIKNNQNDISFCMISSVNHQGLNLLVKILNQYKIPYETITPEIMDDFCLKYNYKVTNTSYLGADLFCDIIAIDTSPIIVIDLGTVGKILFLDENKVFHGAAIFPDIEQYAKIMDASTDLLKEYALKENPPIVSLKTDECISSGALNGMSCLILGMIEKIKKEYHLNNDCHIYLTGGCSRYIKSNLINEESHQIIYEPDLCLKGIQRIFNERKRK